MDPKTGELLAIATTPRMDPNEYWKYEESFPKGVPYNRAISTPYEPGSVFKVLTMAAALDYGAVKPDTVYVDKGVIEVGGGYIYNWNGGAWGPQTMLGCMQHSLNVCLAWVATQLKSTNFYNYMRAFGIGHLTGVDLAGEQYWPLRVPGDKNWYKVDLATNAFGQGVAVTPMQMVMAISAIANNEGKMMTPHVLRAVVTNQRQYPTVPVVAGTPIKPETARTLTNMLSVSLEKESSVALVPGYKVAGKTGTAEIPTETGYSNSFWNASFVGWGPVDDPRFLVYIWLEKPASSKWGSVVAAPIFSEAVKKLVVLMDIPPDDVRHQLTAQAAKP
jgi:cell division protein FtsI/penicillin-binding protein 2